MLENEGTVPCKEFIGWPPQQKAEAEPFVQTKH